VVPGAPARWARPSSRGLHGGVHIVSQETEASAAELPAWFDLFDPHHREYVLRAIEGSVEDAAIGRGAEVGGYLRRWLLDPLDAYLNFLYVPGQPTNLESKRGQELHDVVQDLADKLQDRWPFERGDGATFANGISMRWLECAAVGAPALLTWASDASSERQRASRTAACKRAASQLRKGTDLTPEVLAQYVKDNPSKNRKAVKAELCGQYKVSDRTIEMRWSLAKSMGLLPPQ
jgi:hypothetical protein